jgi:hypothetical protein
MPTPSRGTALETYDPAISKGAGFGATSSFINASGIKNGHLSAKSVTSAKIRAAFLSGTLVSGKTMFAVAHGLGVKPKMVVACAIVTRTQASGATPSTVNVGISAATSANIYLIASGTKAAAVNYVAYVQL